MAVMWAPPAVAVPALPVTSAAPRQAPISARERKQVYMHSAIFHEQGPPPQSVYATHHQSHVMGQVQQTLRTPRVHREVKMASPRDMKATANSGHGVVLTHQTVPGDGAAPATEGATVRQHGYADPHQLRHVTANREDVGMPREFRNTQTNLQWTDMRSVQQSCRGQYSMGASANERKRVDMSSEVFGTTRRVEKSTENASREICSVELADMMTSDSMRDRNFNKDTMSPKASARNRHGNNLLPSNESQFSVYSPRSPRDGARQDTEEKTLDDKRRKERNFSNLFGKPTGERSGSMTKRTEIYGTTNCSFLDAHVEIARRKQEPRAASPETIYCPKPTCLDTPDRNATDTQTACQERACWDTNALMSATSEVARRRREKHGGGAGGASSPGLERSASERKRVELTSGQFRQGMGINRLSHDDGRMGPGVATPTLRTSRSLSEDKGNWRSYRPDSARARKIASLTSSGIF